MKTVFIVNPKAGKGKKEKQLIEQICTLIALNNTDWEWYLTQSVGDATRFVKEYCETKGVARFIACGGDGTFGEVVNGVFGFPDAEVGVIPIGTGNDFSRNFSDKQLFFDIDAQLDGVALPIDVLKYNDSYSVNMINIGFDCEVVKKKEKLQEKKYLPSKLAYIFGLVICLLKKPGLRAKVLLDGKEIPDSDFLLSTFANGAFCGGGFNSNPRARLDDGKVDALFVRNISRLKFVSLVSSYKQGTHLVPKNEKILFAEKAGSIRFEFPHTQSISVDGEIVDCDELTIECVKEALRFVVPRGSAPISMSTEAAQQEIPV